MWAVLTGVVLLAGVAWGQQPEAAEEAVQQMRLSEIIATGGWVMYVLGAMSVIGLAMVIYFFTVLRAEQVTPRAITTELRDALAAGHAEQARAICLRRPAPVTAVTLAALDYLDEAEQADAGLVKEVMEGEGSRQAALIQTQTSYLLDIGVIAPMVGLLGTVLGMLTAFNAVALDIARAKPIYLAQGVSQALITTAGGLIVGIPAMIFYAYFRGHTSKLIARLETVAAELMPLLMRLKKQ
jgi:biopolymer transport protein ExbB